jgi:hypothetical protein
MTGEEMARALEDYVNHTRNHEEFIDYIVNNTHRTLNQSIILLFIKTMRAQGKTTRFDGRNEASVKACKALDLDSIYLPYI